MSKTTATIKIAPPSEIIDEAIRKAIKPHVPAIREACRVDREHFQRAAAAHPDDHRRAAMGLLERGATGDASAYEELERFGGVEGYVSHKSALYHHHVGAGQNHAKNCAPLLAALVADLVPALNAAGEQIQAQFESTMGALGELPGGISEHSAEIRNRCNGLEAAVGHAGRGIGVAYLVEQLGLAPFIG